VTGTGPERDHSTVSKLGLPVLGVAATIGLWWLATIVYHIRAFLLPSPPDVARSLQQQHVLLLQASWVTLKETVAGFTVGSAGAVVLALILTSVWSLRQAVMPVLVAANSIPKLAIAPLLVIWMGFGQLPKVVMVVLLCFFPVLLSAVSGLTATPADLSELSRALCASWWKTFLRIRLPWAMPQIFVGLKVAVSLAVIGAVVAEYVNSTEGLGNVILTAGPQGDTSLAFAAIALLTVQSVVLYFLLVAAQRVALPWSPAQ
jgi:NitT/TauT family transport system permease protein